MPKDFTECGEGIFNTKLQLHYVKDLSYIRVAEWVEKERGGGTGG